MLLDYVNNYLITCFGVKLDERATSYKIQNLTFPFNLKNNEPKKRSLCSFSGESSTGYYSGGNV